MTRALLQALIFCGALAVTTAHAQTRPAPDAPAPPQSRTTQAAADEDFELNISERRIAESDLYAATELAAGDARGRGLALRVGVMVRAGHVDVLLREVHGRVRFRADLGPVLRLLEVRRADSQAAPAAAPSIPPK